MQVHDDTVLMPLPMTAHIHHDLDSMLYTFFPHIEYRDFEFGEEHGRYMLSPTEHMQIV